MLGIAVLASCEKEISQEFIIERNTFLDNKTGLDSIRQSLQNIQEIYAARGFENATTKQFLGNDVTIADGVKMLFDPETCPCSLPEKIKRKLRRLKEDGRDWAPADVVSFLKTFPSRGKHLQGTSVNALLHYVKIKSANGTEREWLLLESPTYKNFDFEKYILKSAKNSFVYTLDCSGYLNAAIQASAEVPGADIQTSAKSALETQKSMLVGGGVLISPINAAYYGESFGISYTKEDRIAILNALLNLPDINDTDQIIVSSSFEVIWSSKEGSSSFNGQASFKGGAGGGFGVASISVKGDTGGEISRSSSFTAFDTYFTSTKVIPDLKPFTIQNVKDLKSKLLAPATTSDQ